MKKLIALTLCMLLVVAALACGKTAEVKPAEDKAEAAQEATNNETQAAAEQTEQQEPAGMPEDEPISGGWANTEDPAMTDELRAIFEKALAELVGVNYTPIACLGTQVVAGTNYCFLAQATVVYPDAKPTYALVYVYQDLQGGATVMNFADMPVIPNENGEAEPIPADETLMGGWAYAESYEITDEIKDRLGKALEKLVGANYEPVANLATQVVAGQNRCLLCKISPVVPNPVPHYTLVYVYEDLEGGAEITQTIDLDVGALCTYGA
jgi:hypothetical protein